MRDWILIAVASLAIVTGFALIGMSVFPPDPLLPMFERWAQAQSVPLSNPEDYNNSLLGRLCTVGIFLVAVPGGIMGACVLGALEKVDVTQSDKGGAP